MRKYISRIAGATITCFITIVTSGMENATDCMVRWRELISEGSNYVNRPLGVRMKQPAQKWFCEIARYELPTNNVDQYVSWMNQKANLIASASWMLNTDQSYDEWYALAEFLSKLRRQYGAYDSVQFMHKHREDWGKSNNLLTMEEWGKWKKAYMIARSYRSAWSRAAIAIEHMIEQVAGSMPPERRKMFMDTLISKTKVVPDWYSKEMKSVEEGQKGLSESLSAIVERSHSGESLDMNEVHLTMKKATLIYDEKTRESLTCNFRAALFAVNMQIVDSAKKSAIIHAVIDAARALWTEMQNANLPKQECWQLRLQTLSWLHSLLKQLEPDKKAEGRCFNAEYAQKRNLFLSVRQIYQRLLKTYGDELKSVWYTPEFRAWCLKEIEKIIGRPLTDDDPMFNDEVLNRRKVREQDEKRKGAK